MSAKRAAIFARRSTADRPGQPNIVAQLDACRAFAEANGFEVVREFVEEAISGALSYLERPGIVEMLSEARRGEFDTVILHKVDRFARDQRESARILLDAGDIGLAVVTVETGGELRPFDGFEGILDTVRMAGAQDERKRIKERLVGGRIRGMREGKWPGGPTPYGYRVADDKTLVLDESEAKTLRLIFDLATNPEASVATLTRDLKDRRVRNRVGDTFSKTNLATLLRDPIYAGRGRTVTMGGVNKKGEALGVPEETVTLAAPGVVDPDTFDAIGRTLDRRRKRHYDPQQFHTYALSGRIVHLHDDGSVWGLGGEHPGRERLYRCQSAKPGHPGCPGTSPEGTPVNRRRTSVGAALVERYILALGLRMIDSPEVIQEMADDATRTRLALESTQDSREEIEARLVALDKERGSTLEQNRKGWLSDAETTSVMEDLARRKADLEAELAALGRKVSVEDIADLISRISVNPESVPEWWSEEYEAPRAGTLTPSDPEWSAVMVGLRDEVRGESPDMPAHELSEWARTWCRHLAEALDLVVVVEPDGTIQATTTDPRQGIGRSGLSTARG